MDIVNKVVCDHKVGNPIVGYVLSSCPRCKGSGYYGGPVFGADGKIVTTSQGPSLSQEIEKVLKENRRSSGYGFDYSLLTGVIDASKLNAIKNEAVRSLLYLRTLQEREERLGYTYMDREKILRIDSVIVKQDSTDPRSVSVSIVVISNSGSAIGVTTSLKR